MPIGARDAPVAGAEDGCVYYDRRPEFFRPGRDIKRMKPVNIRSVVIRLGLDIDRVCRSVDSRGRGSSNIGLKVFTGSLGVRGRLLSASRVDQARLPKISRVCARVAVGIERIDRVGLRCHEKNIVMSLAGDRQTWDIQRLSENLIVNGEGEELSKLGGIDVCGREDRFACVLSSPAVVVMPGGDAHLRLGSQG